MCVCVCVCFTALSGDTNLWSFNPLTVRFSIAHRVYNKLTQTSGSNLRFAKKFKEPHFSTVINRYRTTCVKRETSHNKGIFMLSSNSLPFGVNRFTKTQNLPVISLLAYHPIERFSIAFT